jgi:hypothetical protein
MSFVRRGLAHPVEPLQTGPGVERTGPRFSSLTSFLRPLIAARTAAHECFAQYDVAEARERNGDKAAASRDTRHTAPPA